MLLRDFRRYDPQIPEQTRLAGVGKLHNNAVTLSHRRMSWNGMYSEFISLERPRAGVCYDLLTRGHMMFLGVGGKSHETVVEVDGLPKWRGMKGNATSGFYASGTRMRTLHAAGVDKVVILVFDPDATEVLLHKEKALSWKSRPSTDEAFIAANAVSLAMALQEDTNDLATLRAESIATSLHLHCVSRFSSLGSQGLTTGSGVERAIDLIHTLFPRAVSLEELAMASGLSRRQLLIDFRRRTNTSPHQYILRERLSRAQFLLATTTGSLSSIAKEVGCASAEHLSRLFRQHFNMSPRTWKAKNIR